MVELRHQPLLSNTAQSWEVQEVGPSWAFLPPDQERVNKNCNRSLRGRGNLIAQGRRKSFWRFQWKTLSGKLLHKRQNKPLRIICHSANKQCRELWCGYLLGFSKREMNINEPIDIAHSYGNENGPQSCEKRLQLTPEGCENHSSRETGLCTYQIGNAPGPGDFSLRNSPLLVSWNFLYSQVLVGLI